MTGLVPGSFAGNAGTMYLMPVLLAEDVPIDAVGINVVTAVAATTHRGLIYAPDATSKPDTLLLDSIFDTATTGLKTNTITRQVLPRGLLWIGGMNLGGTPGITVISGNPFLPVSPTQMASLYSGAVARTGLAAPPNPAGAVVTVGNAPRLQFRMVE
jgi:hypothetical protein